MTSLDQNKSIRNGIAVTDAFLYTENHSLGEWFERSLMAIMMTTKTPFAKIKVRSANCTKKAKGGHPDE